MIWNWVFILLLGFGNGQLLDDSKEQELLRSRVRNLSASGCHPSIRHPDAWPQLDGFLTLLQRIKNEYNKENDPTRLRISIENNQERYLYKLMRQLYVQFVLLFLEAS